MTPVETQPQAAETRHVDEPPPRRRRKVARYIIALAALIVLAIGGVFLWNYLRSYESTDDAQIDGHMNYISTRIPGTITRVNVVENQAVQQGQILLELDPRDYQAELDQAQANRALAQAQVHAENPNVAITLTSTATNIEATQADVANALAAAAAAERDRLAAMARLLDAEATNAKAQADLARYKMLVAKEEVSREEYDQRAAAAQSAAAMVENGRQNAAAAQHIVEQRRAVVAQNQSRLQGAQVNAPHQVAQQRANVSSRMANVRVAEAALEQATLNLEYTKIYAPVQGIIGRKTAEVGMRVQAAQQLMVVVPTDDIWVTANFKESQLREMRPGQSARIHVDAYNRDYDGYVESMPAATGAKYSLLPPENATGNYVKVVQRLPVRVRFKANQDPEHLLRPGMSVVPKVWLR
jgi:membrane fusion protein (multidrug efflux system)